MEEGGAAYRDGTVFGLQLLVCSLSILSQKLIEAASQKAVTREEVSAG